MKTMGQLFSPYHLLLSPCCRVMKDSSLLQRDGVSYKTAESEEKREKDEKKRRTVGRRAR